MLLRRITKQVTDQNWFAVFIDFLIVVVGVFIGIQVANWNAERKDRIEERILLQRLYQESRSLLEVNTTELQIVERRTESLGKAMDVLFSDDETRELTELECASVIGSHVYRKAYDQLPILEELLATGDLKLISDQSIKNELRAYITYRGRLQSNDSERTNELFRLHSRYPELIEISQSEFDQAIFKFEHLNIGTYGECKTFLMRQNQKFINELFDNAARMNSLVTDFRQQNTFLKNLINQLEEVGE